MSIRPGIKEAVWMAVGAALLAAVVGLVLRFQDDGDAAGRLAVRAGRLEAVDRMTATLAAASEAEKSAVLAATPDDAQAYADEARTAMAAVERDRLALSESLSADGTARERDALVQFAESLADVRRIDEGLLALAVQGSNAKATALAFGPAREAVAAMSAALARVVAGAADPPDAAEVRRLADAAQIGALRVEVLLPPHIGEEDDRRMDALETEMATSDADVRRDLAALASRANRAGNADVAAAAASYDRFTELRTQILALSRQNTNVRSLSISLGQKRRAARLAREALGAVRQAVAGDATPGGHEPARPR